MTAADQVRAQLLEIVDLAVKHHPDRAIFIADRLVAGTKIDDAEPAHADPARAVDVIAVIIRTAVANLVAHPADVSQLGLPVTQKLSGDATHRSRPRLRSLFRLSQFEAAG